MEKETNTKQDLRLGVIEKHVKIMNTEMGELRDEMKLFNADISGVKIQVTKIATDLGWLIRIMFPLFMLVLTGFVGALIKLVLE